MIGKLWRILLCSMVIALLSMRAATTCIATETVWSGVNGDDSNDWIDIVVTKGTAKECLDKDGQTIYDFIKGRLLDIMEHGGETTFQIPVWILENDELFITSEEVEGPLLTDERRVTDEAYNALVQKASKALNISQVIYALEVDSPYELTWWSHGSIYGFSIQRTSVSRSSGRVIQRLLSLISLSASFSSLYVFPPPNSMPHILQNSIMSNVYSLKSLSCCSIWLILIK